MELTLPCLLNTAFRSVARVSDDKLLIQRFCEAAKSKKMKHYLHQVTQNKQGDLLTRGFEFSAAVTLDQTCS